MKFHCFIVKLVELELSRIISQTKIDLNRYLYSFINITSQILLERFH